MKKGRPSSYKQEYVEQVYKLCLLSATDTEIADIFGCAESTLNLWKKIHKDFSESIKRGKLIADADVAYSLHKRALGYRYTEKEYKDGILVKEVEKEVSPDTGAAMAWLKNRKPKEWRDKRDIEMSGALDNNVVIKIDGEEFD